MQYNSIYHDVTNKKSDKLMQSLFFAWQVMVEIPYIFCQAAVYCVLVYAMIGFERTAEKFFWYLFFAFFSMLYFTLYGMMAVAVTPNLNLAAIVSTAFYGIWNLFSGFVIPEPVSVCQLMKSYVLRLKTVSLNFLVCFPRK